MGARTAANMVSSGDSASDEEASSGSDGGPGGISDEALNGSAADDEAAPGMQRVYVGRQVPAAAARCLLRYGLSSRTQRHPPAALARADVGHHVGARTLPRGCSRSPIFDANTYPNRSTGHETSAAENSHSLNKPLKNHLYYLGKDRFVVHMRLHGAFNDLRTKYRRRLPRSWKTLTQVGHRPLSPFFHNFCVNHCEKGSCPCRIPFADPAPPTPPSSFSSSSISADTSGLSTPSWHSDDWGTKSSRGGGSWTSSSTPAESEGSNRVTAGSAGP